MNIDRPFSTISAFNLDNIKVRIFSKHNPNEQIKAGFVQAMGGFVALYKSMNLDQINDAVKYCSDNIENVFRIEFINPRNENTISVDI